MNHFIQLHLLTSYPPANLNRDDLGRPKTAIMGGEERLRISSQSLKRAWRTSELFESALAGHIGTRSREYGETVRKSFLAADINEKNALAWARDIAAVFGKLQKDSAKIEQLAHYSPEEQTNIDQLIQRCIDTNTAPEQDDLQLLRKQHQAADIALFGRMLASSPAYNMEAAAQVAHAISVNKIAIENDFFTAVDDLNNGENDPGAAHMGETEFAAGLFYLYICIDHRLLSNNRNDTVLVNKTLRALVEAAATVAPTGKQNSFASRARASYILAEKGDQQPRSLSVAFLKSIDAYQNGMLSNAIISLETTRKKMDEVYGACADHHYTMNADADKNNGSLADLLNFITE